MKKQKMSLKHLKKYQKESVLAPLFKLLEALIDLTVPLVIAQIIKNGFCLKDVWDFVVACGIRNGILLYCTVVCG